MDRSVSQTSGDFLIISEPSLCNRTISKNAESCTVVARNYIALENAHYAVLSNVTTPFVNQLTPI